MIYNVHDVDVNDVHVDDNVDGVDDVDVDDDVDDDVAEDVDGRRVVCAVVEKGFGTNFFPSLSSTMETKKDRAKYFFHTHLSLPVCWVTRSFCHRPFSLKCISFASLIKALNRNHMKPCCRKFTKTKLRNPGIQEKRSWQLQQPTLMKPLCRRGVALAQRYRSPG